LQRFSDPPLKTHQACGGALRRLISPPTFQFKGTGWYVTDYAKGHDHGGAKGHNGRNGKDEAAPKQTDAAKPKPPESKSAKTSDSTSKS
jgi:predicted nucleic acid-binding Zn ribbon protein